MKELKDMSFNELVDLATGNLIVAIGKGQLHGEVYSMLHLAVLWRVEMDIKAAKEEKREAAKEKRRKR